MKIVYKPLWLLLALPGSWGGVSGQSVTVTGTIGTPSAAYTSLATALDSINSGVHQGVITVTVSGTLNETVRPTLVDSGNGLASYTSVSIRPNQVNGVQDSVKIAPAANVSALYLEDADNVTVNGLDASGNLVWMVTAGAQVDVAVIRLGDDDVSSTGCENVTIQNNIIIGNNRDNDRATYPSHRNFQAQTLEDRYRYGRPHRTDSANSQRPEPMPAGVLNGS